ncbi:MAG TPA: pirin family protein [Microbacterium sp.]|nr:pirin family protein [Microbacterium sp.]HWI31399.1 pirin family protein [Microbacterium sp.]
MREAPARCDGPRSLVLESREVPLGGVRGMAVHRALPQRDLPMVGAWCFLDRFGPQRTRMRVEPHPHIGLQTVTWPFVGEVRHRDSVGSDVVVRRGVLNLMTSGLGISHSEYSVGDDEVALDALQLWVALPDDRRFGGPEFERHDDLPEVAIAAEEGDAAWAIVVMGEFADAVSPATAYTPIVGAEVRIAPGSRVRLPLRPDWEYALVAIDGDLTADASAEASVVTLERGRLVYLGIARESIEVASASGASIFMLGGEPFPDDIVMWWNFVGRDHDEIVEARQAWESGSSRFGHVVDHGDERIPAPPLPAVRLTPRRRRT